MGQGITHVKNEEFCLQSDILEVVLQGRDNALLQKQKKKKKKVNTT